MKIKKHNNSRLQILHFQTTYRFPSALLPTSGVLQNMRLILMAALHGDGLNPHEDGKTAVLHRVPTVDCNAKNDIIMTATEQREKKVFTDSYRKHTFINTPLTHHSYVHAYITHFIRVHILSKVINYLHLRHVKPYANTPQQNLFNVHSLGESVALSVAVAEPHDTLRQSSHTQVSLFIKGQLKLTVSHAVS